MIISFLISLPIGFGLYFFILSVVLFVLRKAKCVSKTNRSVLCGAMVGYLIAVLMIPVATIVVESNETFWWYGPHWRFDLLMGVVTVISVAALVVGPIWSLKRKSVITNCAYLDESK